MKKKLFIVVLFVLFILLFPLKVKIQFDSPVQFTTITGKNETQNESVTLEIKTASNGVQYAIVDFGKWIKYDYWRVDYQSDKDIAGTQLDIAIGNMVVGQKCLTETTSSKNVSGDNESSVSIDIKETSIYRNIAIYWILYICTSTAILIVLYKKRKFEILHDMYEIFIGAIHRVSCRKVIFPSMFILCIGMIFTNIVSYKKINILIQPSEIVFVTLAEILIYCIFYFRVRDKKYAGLFCTLVFPVLVLSVERLTTFYTVDEPYNVYRLLDFPENVDLWFNHTSMISSIIMNYSLRIFTSIFKECKFITIEEFCKLIHWLYGTVIIFFITDVAIDKIIDKKYNLSRKRIIFNYVFIAYILLLLPTNELALKNFNNYDLFSLMFGVLAFEYFYLSFKNDSIKYSRIAFILSILGFVEKVNVLPLFVLCGSGYIYNSCKKGKWAEFFKCLTNIIVYCYVFISSFSVIIIYGVAQNNSQILNALVYPFDMLGYSSYRLIWKIGGILQIQTISSGRTLLVRALSIIAILGGMILGSCVIKAIVLCTKKFKFKYISQISICIMLIIYAIGIIISYIISVYDYSKFGSFMCKVICNYVNAIPTAVIIFLIFVLFRKEINKLLCVLLTSCIIFTSLIYAIIQEFAAARYMNIYICIDVLIIAILFLEIDYKRTFLSFCIVLQLFLLFEVFPSAPAYTFFYPIWNYSYSDDEIGSRVYWGEQIMIAGELIEKYCMTNNISLENVKMYCGYGGTWNENENNIEVIGASKWIQGEVDYGIEQSDFYVFDSQALIRDIIPYGVPENVEPIITIKYRGAVIMRIYTGTQLENYLKRNICY